MAQSLMPVTVWTMSPRTHADAIQVRHYKVYYSIKFFITRKLFT
jgi:hypothetical protein